MTVKIEQRSFVSASVLFDGCPLAKDAFDDSDPDCVWGSNSHTLVTGVVIRDALDEVTPATDCLPADLTGVGREVLVVLARLDDLLGPVFIDLES